MQQSWDQNIIVETLPDGASFEMVKVEGGSFVRQGQTVSVPAFYLGKYPVTQALWEHIMGENPSRFKGNLYPVERVSWYDVQIFLQKLNEKNDKNYRLPSESEWEFAARGGNFSHGLRFAGSNKLKEVGWYGHNSHRETKPVGLKLPNELGLYDMSGNVWEWCADHWHTNFTGAPNEGSAWVEGGNKNFRVVRGGSWYDFDSDCTVSGRLWNDGDFRNYDIGFRIARY